MDGCDDFYDRKEGEINDDLPKAKGYGDKCAWYEKFHIRSNSEWGIHIKESCLIQRGRILYKWNKATTTPNDSVKAAFLRIMCHELFHYVSDCSATILELINNNPALYKEYMEKVFWIDYDINPEGALEEALANRYVYGRYKFMRINKHLLITLMKSQYKGYRDFDKYLGSNFKKGRRK